MSNVPTVHEFYFSWMPGGSPTSIAISELQNREIGRFRRMKIKHFVMDTTFYAVSSINNAFELEEDGSGTWLAGTLTPGNYTVSTFSAEVKTRLEAIGAGTYTVSISSESSKITIAVSGGASTFSIRFTESDRQKEKLWGVAAGTAQNLQIPNTGSYTSSKVVHLWGPTMINFTSSTLNKMLSEENHDITGGVSDVLMRVPLTVNTGSQQIVFDEDWRLAVNQIMKPTTIVADITDESGNSIDLNGGEVHITIAMSS